MMPELDAELHSIYKVDWITYAYAREKGKLGLGDFIAQCYGLEEGFCLLECTNDSNLSFFASCKEELKPYQKNNIEDALRFGSCPEYKLCDILQDLVNKDLIPVGEYLIRVSW